MQLIAITYFLSFDSPSNNIIMGMQCYLIQFVFFMPEYICLVSGQDKIMFADSETASNIQDFSFLCRDALLRIFLENTVLSYCRSEPIEMIYCFLLWCHR